jgi:hypothetical protein
LADKPSAEGVQIAKKLDVAFSARYAVEVAEIAVRDSRMPDVGAYETGHDARSVGVVVCEERHIDLGNVPGILVVRPRNTHNE